MLGAYVCVHTVTRQTGGCSPAPFFPPPPPALQPLPLPSPAGSSYSYVPACSRSVSAAFLRVGGGARGGRSGAHFPAPSPAPDDQTQTVPNGKFERTNNNHVCQPRLRTAPVCNQKSDSPHKQPKQKKQTASTSSANIGQPPARWHRG